MKRLLEEALDHIEESQWQFQHDDETTRCTGCWASFSYPGNPEDQVHNPDCPTQKLTDRLRAALSAYQPDPSPEMMILLGADGLEDKGDWRAETIRELMCETPDVAKVLASIKADGAEGYCTLRHTGGGNYTISALPVSDVAMTFAVSDGCPWVPDADQ